MGTVINNKILDIWVNMSVVNFPQVIDVAKVHFCVFLKNKLITCVKVCNKVILFYRW